MVDGNPRDLALARRDLQRDFADVAVREIADAEGFQGALEAGGFDVVITDFSIPWGDGLAVLDAVKGRWPEVPVLMFTATGSQEVAVEAMKRGLDDYVVKSPEHVVRLPAAVRTALERHATAGARRRVERALRASEERFRLLVESFEDYAIFMLDAEGRIASWNTGAERIFGWTTEEIVGRPLGSFYVPEDAAVGVVETELAEARREGRASDTRWLVRRDGSRFWADGITAPVRDEDQLRGFAKIVRDATARKRFDEERADLLSREQRLRAEAETANRTKDDFLATVSHELRTPLNAILGWARLLRTRTLDPASVARALETIERNADAQRQLVEDLLDVSRIITGRLRLEVRLVDLPETIEAAIDSVQPAARAKAIRVESELDPDAGPVTGDPSRLQQVVWNLLSNAVKFTPPRGRVVVRLEAPPGEAVIRITDTGGGVPEAFLGRIFDRFSQAESTTTRSHKGLGLGLAIVRHLVELHGGTVEVENSPVAGWGASFAVRLPLAPSARAAALDVVPDDEAAGDLAGVNQLAGLHVLVVDDDDDGRELVASMLETCGARVTAVGSVAEALARLEEQRFDALVSDIAMPDRDGYELIRTLRARPPDRGGLTPAVALTARARVGDRLRALSAGFQLHLPKPVEPAELCVVVASLAGRARAA